MKILAYSAFVIGTILLTTVACSKSEQKQETAQKNNSIFEDFPSPIQKFFISNAKDTTITGENETRIFIPKDAFNTDDRENIQLILIEYYKKKDMLMGGLTTMTEDGKLLISGGMIYLSANNGDTALEINDGKELSIYFNQDYNKENLPMKPFIGYPNSREPGSGEILKWVLDKEVITAGRDSSISKITLDNGQVMTSEIVELDNQYFRTQKLGWINADDFYNYNKTTNIVVELDKSLPVAVRIVFLDRKSIMPLFIKNDGNYYAAKVHIGERVALLAFSKINDRYFLASKRITVKESHPVEKLNLKEVSFEEIKEELERFN